MGVEGDQIRGSDLALAIHAFKVIPPDVSLAPLPLPGGTRVFSAAELQSLATRFGVNVDAVPEICFQTLTGPLSPEAVLKAMQASLRIPGVHIELLEVSSQKVPRGRLEFPREGLGTPALPERKSPVLWRGAVVYGTGLHFAIWGRVLITAPVTRLIAVENLKAGVPIQPNQLRAETVEIFPVLSSVPDTEQIAGMLPLRSISGGNEVRMDNLTLPMAVHRGDRVRVEVRLGPAHLSMNGRAESNGRIGDTIPILNPDSARTFRARVEGINKVIVEVAGREGQ